MDSRSGRTGDPVWDNYDAFMGVALSHGQKGKYNKWGSAHTELANKGITSGDIPDELAAALSNAIRRSRTGSWDSKTGHPQFINFPVNPEKTEGLRTGMIWYSLSAEALWHLGDLYDHMRDHVAESLGAPWRVLGNRCWGVTRDILPEGPNKYHLDGLPIGIYKIMVYLQPMNREYGTIQVQLASGEEIIFEREKPTWVLFKPSELQHRAIAPSLPDYSRLSIEVKLIPSPKFYLVPYETAQLDRIPVRPWYRAWGERY
jgi:hypothetical protein